MITYILLGLLLFSVWFIWYMGFHKRIAIERKLLPKRYVLYGEHVVNYSRDMKKVFDRLNSDVKDVFQHYVCFGIYYDNPAILVDPTKCRASIGIYVEDNDVTKAQGFATVHKQYKFKQVPPMNAISATQTYRNGLSILWAVKKIFPALLSYLGQHNLVQDYINEIDGILEIYHWGGPNKWTEFLIPYGKEIKQYSLTSIPHPPIKYEFQAKRD